MFLGDLNFCQLSLDSNPGRLREKHKCYLSATPYPPKIIMSFVLNLIDRTVDDGNDHRVDGLVGADTRQVPELLGGQVAGVVDAAVVGLVETEVVLGKRRPVFVSHARLLVLLHIVLFSFLLSKFIKRNVRLLILTYVLYIILTELNLT